MTKTPMVTQLDVESLIPYEFNPRKNEQAIDAVANSIRQFGFLVPIVVDQNNLIVCGHTRHAALLRLMAEDPETAEQYRMVNVVVAEHLTPDQLRAFRLIDNKTAEIATWDFDLLSKEIGELYESGIEFQQFGWSQEEIDCLHSVVSDDCLQPAHYETEKEGGMGGITFNRKQFVKEARDGSTRIHFGDLSFLVLKDDYQAWMTEMMKANDYDPVAVVEAVAERMGLLQAKLKRDQRVKDGTVSPEAEEMFDQTGDTEGAESTAKENIAA